MRRILGAVLAGIATLALAAGPAAGAGTDRSASASAGGLTATLSWAGGLGPTTRNVRLRIARRGRLVYDEPVPATGCFKVCGPADRHPVHVAKLYGNDGEDVILALWSGGADCCVLANVYVPSAAVHSYVLDQHNFGEGGFALRDIGPHHRPEFVSADPGFYCRFTACAESALPVEIFEFKAESFINVTRQHPALIRADAARWLRLYKRNPRRGLGAIAAWAGDEDNLGRQATVRRVLARQHAEHHLTRGFISSLQRFLAAGHYTR